VIQGCVQDIADVFRQLTGFMRPSRPESTPSSHKHLQPSLAKAQRHSTPAQDGFHYELLFVIADFELSFLCLKQSAIAIRDKKLPRLLGVAKTS